MTDRLRVLIADDHAPTRAGVRDSLERDGFDICAEVANADDCVTSAIELRPDVCVVDIHMPGSGINAVRRITSELPDTPVVMLTYSRDDDDLFDALRAGAVGYLVKDMNSERLGASLRGVLHGESALPRNLMARVIDEFREREKRHLFARRNGREPLTSREWEVAELLRSGASTEAIASRLGMSRATVRVHVSNITRKLRVDSRDNAVRVLNELD